MVFAIVGPVVRAAIPDLCERVRTLLERCDVDVVICDVGALTRPDAATIDALARLQLTARRTGRRIRLRHACAELQQLLELMGLSDAIPVAGRLLPDEGRQAEQREQGRGVEEERDPADSTG
jgi:ABC-type transporter Mla MlaB component